MTQLHIFKMFFYIKYFVYKKLNACIIKCNVTV